MTRAISEKYFGQVVLIITHLGTELSRRWKYVYASSEKNDPKSIAEVIIKGDSQELRR